MLLKGATTVIADGDGQVRLSLTGTPRLATAGTGDVLTGVIAALLSAGFSGFDAASIGAFVDGLAGRLAAERMRASDGGRRGERHPQGVSRHHASLAARPPARWEDERVSQHLRELVVDLDAIAANTRVLVDRSASGNVMAVVKADAYGHGLVPSAKAAVRGGASWLGVALLDEALQLRAAGVGAPILSWLVGPGEQWGAALDAGIDLSASAPWILDEIAGAARDSARVARVHLKVHSGLGRSGAPVGEWPTMVEAARKAELDGVIDVVGDWSHLHIRGRPGTPDDRPSASDVHRRGAGWPSPPASSPQVRHLANSAATLTRPDTHFDLTRPGLSVYGLSPLRDAPPTELGLHPAMSLLARLAVVKRVPPGHGVPTFTGTSLTARQPWAWYPSATPTEFRATRRTSVQSWSAAGAGRWPVSYAWISSCSTWTMTQCRSVTWSPCSVLALTVSPRPRTGLTRAARSRTRSSRGSGLA